MRRTNTFASSGLSAEQTAAHERRERWLLHPFPSRVTVPVSSHGLLALKCPRPLGKRLRRRDVCVKVHDVGGVCRSRTGFPFSVLSSSGLWVATVVVFV